MADKDAAVMHLEDQTSQGITADDAEFLENFTDEAKKKVLRKVRPIYITQSIEGLLTVCV
jgi:hypothetical protein